MKRIASVIVAWIILFPIMANAQTGSLRTEVSGRVFIHDTTTHPGDYVLVYAQACGAGTLTDEDGYYTLKLPAGTSREVELEYSRIGYTSVTNKVTLSGGTQHLDDVTMEFQALMIAAAFVSADGRDAADIIISKLMEQVKETRKKKFDYWADINYDFATHDIAIAASAFSKLTVGAAKAFASHEGYGPLIRYCLKNDDVEASVSLSRSVKGDQTVDMRHKLTKCNTELPPEVKKNAMSLFDMIDLFDMLYGNANAWGEKFSKKHKFKLVGNYEYNGQMVDVIKWTEHRNRGSATIHVIEDKWMILKVQVHSTEGEVLRCEARDIGNGIYMPISFLMKPSVAMVKREHLLEEVELSRQNKDMSKATEKRILKILEEHPEEDFNPYISVGYNVRYRIGK